MRARWWWFILFKQKTAYEMRISEWSSDVCSSDLSGERLTPARLRALPDDAPLIVRDDGGRLIRLPAARVKPILATLIELYDEQPLQKDGSLRLPRWSGVLPELGRASCRETGCQYV